MTWHYQQTTGKMMDEHGYVWGIGYSGAGEGKNQPEFQQVHDVGPIPQGGYVIGAPHDSPEHGPYVLPLIPHAGTELYGRSAFLIHGDSVHVPGTASHGCIIMSRDVRNEIWRSGDHSLVVTSGLEEQQERIT